MALSVSALYCFPVKSLGGMELNRAEIDRFGIQQDRRWMLVDENGQFLTQRQCAEMVFLTAQWLQGKLQITHKNGDQIELGREDFAGDTCQVQVWRDQCAAIAAPLFANQWLSDHLGRPCRLVYMPDSTFRRVDQNYAKQQETVSFADGFPLLLTTTASLENFNQHLPQAIEMLRFRPNLVISGSEPWAEDNWQRIKVGELVFDVVKPCSRCAIPTINRSNAQKEPEVFKALKKYRSQGKEVFFGQNLIPQQQGIIKVGDRVEVLK